MLRYDVLLGLRVTCSAPDSTGTLTCEARLCAVGPTLMRFSDGDDGAGGIHDGKGGVRGPTGGGACRGKAGAGRAPCQIPHLLHDSSLTVVGGRDG